MSTRLEGITLRNTTTWTAKAEVEEQSTVSAADAQLKLARKLRERADAIEHDVDRARSVMAP